MSWWKHAFAIEPDGPAVPTAEQQPVIDGLCQRIVDRGLALPAILFLESCKPLGPVAAQSLLVVQPWFELVINRDQLAIFTRFLDRRGSFDYLCQRLEELVQSRETTLESQPRPAGSGH